MRKGGVPSAALQCTIIFTFISPNSADIRGLVKTGLGQQDGDDMHNFYAGSGDAGRINRHQILRPSCPLLQTAQPRPPAERFPMSPTLHPVCRRGAHPQTHAPHVDYCLPCPRPQQPQPPQPYTQHQHPHAEQPPPPPSTGPAPQRVYAPYPVGVMYGAPPPPQGA
ncbi:hypothetical protein B0H14DRAFT_2710618 [Mycena olivaceomarginata]|nr:hypothetical protein B0H14DRAFT_2710618 [Mycena olivaceomarginata]